MVHHTPNETLMGLEALTQRNFEAVLKDRYDQRKYDMPTFETVAIHEVVGIRLTVAYHPRRKWRYEFQAYSCGVLDVDGVHGFYDTREACLDSLAAHWPEVVA